MVMNGVRSLDASRARHPREVAEESHFETDAELVAALRRSDVGAAGRVYDRHVATVQRVVHRLLGPRADHEDIVQDVFIYALYSSDKLRDPAALKAWLVGIAAGKVRGHLRRSWVRRGLSFLTPEQLAELPGEAPDPHSELLREVYGILDSLPPDERIALVLRRVEELPVHEAAEACGMSLSTFKRRYARGESRFLARAKQRPLLTRWLMGGAT